MHANNASLSDDSDRSGLNDPLPRSEEDLAIERRMSRILNLLADYVLWILLLLAFHVNNSRALLEKKVGYGEALAYQWPRLLGACAVFTSSSRNIASPAVNRPVSGSILRPSRIWGLSWLSASQWES